MQKMLVLCFFIVILVVLLGGCKETDARLLSNDDILELLAIKELGFGVDEISVYTEDEESTTIFAELSVSEKELSTNGYFQDKMDEISPGIANDLIDYGIQTTAITDFGINYKEFIVPVNNGEEYRPYPIYWFKLDEVLKSKSNILLYASIPGKITLVEETN